MGFYGEFGDLLGSKKFKEFLKKRERKGMFRIFFIDYFIFEVFMCRVCCWGLFLEKYWGYLVKWFKEVMWFVSELNIDIKSRFMLILIGIDRCKFLFGI